jgi:Asp-tRNA(Asn)/Glu-tRNA(Gln) amidotransferase B subunit
MDGIVMAADLLDEGKISSKQVKQILDTCFEKGEDFPGRVRTRKAAADHRFGGHREAD